jgi:predicted DNA-binding transcriptional regulator YafY
MGSEESRGESIGRTLKVVTALLQGQELTARDVKDLLRVEIAAARRHLNVVASTLGTVGLRQRTTRRGKAYSLPPTVGDEAPAALSTAIAACFGASLATLLERTEIGTAMQEATDRVVKRAKQAGLFTDIDRKFFFHVRGGEMALPASARVLKTIVGSLLEGHVIRLDYVDFAGTRHRRLDVEPLSVVVYEHQLYLVGATRGRPLHPYRFSRIEHVEVLEKRFEYPSVAQYSPKQAFRDSLGIFLDPELPIERVAIRLSGRWKTHVRGHRWHESQSIEDDGDDLIVHLHVRLCYELERWILGFGDEAEVLAPRTLRQKIAKRLKAARSRYEGGRSSEDPKIPRGSRRG